MVTSDRASRGWGAVVGARLGVWRQRALLTQEQLAVMLGVGRSYISRVLGVLRARGLIETRRGVLSVSNLDELRTLACGCNDSVRQHFAEVLNGVYPAEGISPEEDARVGIADDRFT